MKLTIELDREVGSRWIAEVPELNVLPIRERSPKHVEVPGGENSQFRGRWHDPDRQIMHLISYDMNVILE